MTLSRVFGTVNTWKRFCRIFQPSWSRKQPRVSLSVQNPNQLAAEARVRLRVKSLVFGVGSAQFWSWGREEQSRFEWHWLYLQWGSGRRQSLSSLSSWMVVVEWLYSPCAISCSARPFLKPLAFLIFARLFWNQILIWDSLSCSSWARAWRRCSVM